jgi:4-hydroxy-4-methyl-2-oxoglutarate aldolase
VTTRSSDERIEHRAVQPLEDVHMTSSDTDRYPAELSTPAVSDTVDTERLDGRVLDGLEPIAVGTRGAVGPARTATVVATDEPGIPGLAEFLDEADAGEILVLGWDAPGPASVFGGLAGTRAAARGCLALVVDGWVRDVRELQAGPLVVWARGRTPRSGKARLAVTGIGETTTVRGVTVQPGDLVVADSSGVAVVAAADADAAVRGAQELERLDGEFERALHDGAGFGRAHRQTGTM